MTPDELREELRYEARMEMAEDARYERLMRYNDDDEEYFTRHIEESTQIIEALEYLKQKCKEFDRDFREELNIFGDMV